MTAEEDLTVMTTRRGVMNGGVSGSLPARYLLLIFTTNCTALFYVCSWTLNISAGHPEAVRISIELLSQNEP